MTNDVTSIAQLLRSIGLPQLISLLKANGVDDVQTLGLFSTDELKQMGVERHGDRMKLFMAARSGHTSVPLPASQNMRIFFEKEDSLTEYMDNVLAQGIDSLQLLQMVEESDMEGELGIIKPGHRKKLLLKLRERQDGGGGGGRMGPPPPRNSSNSPKHPEAVNGGKVSSGSPNIVTRPKSATHRLHLSTLSDDDPHPTTRDKPLSRSWGLSSFTNDDNPVPPHSRRSPAPGHIRVSSNPALVSAAFSNTSAPHHLSDGRATPEDSSDALGTSASSTPSLGGSLGLSSRSPGGRVFMPDQKPDRRRAAVSVGRRPSQLTDNLFRKGHDDGSEKAKLVKVFENGRIKDERGFMLSKTVPLKPRETKDMTVICNVITRALGWNNSKTSIYRQGDGAAGGCVVSQLWAFNGRPLLDKDDIVDGMWVVAGTANSTFQNSTGEKTQYTSTGSMAKVKGTPWADRLSNPDFYTGVQKDKHKSDLKPRVARTAYKREPIKSRMMAARQQVASERREIAIVSGSGSVSPQPQNLRPAASQRGSPQPQQPHHHQQLQQQAQKQLSAPSPPPRNITSPSTPNPSALGGRSATTPVDVWDTTESDPDPPLSTGIDSIEADDMESLVPKDLESANRERLKGWQKGVLLGRGSFGMVYKGTLKDGSDAAVKIVNMGRGDAPVELQQLFREIRFIEQLEHPNIVKYYGCLYDEDQGQVEIFLQLMTGGSIASLTAKHNGKLPEPLCKKYTKQILCGLDYLHCRKVVHRDVKGANVLIDHKGDCAIADFGTSKCIDDMVSKTHGCTTMVGTPYWMAPEVITACDDGAYGTKVDVWSVGCTIVEMITGNPPWSGQHENMWAAIFHIAQSTEPPPLPSDLKKEIRNFLIRCFERDPSKRPSCTQLLADKWMQ